MKILQKVREELAVLVNDAPTAMQHAIVAQVPVEIRLNPLLGGHQHGHFDEALVGAHLNRLGAEGGGDLIGVQGDPLQDVSVLERVAFVMKDGRVYKQPR